MKSFDNPEEVPEDNAVPEDELEAPSLFQIPTHIQNYKKIADLRMQIEDEELDPYVDEFHTGTQDDILMIGNISLEEIQVKSVIFFPFFNWCVLNINSVEEIK